MSPVLDDASVRRPQRWRPPEWLRTRLAIMAGTAVLVAIVASVAVAGLADGVAERGDLTLVDPSVRVAVVAVRDPVLTAAAQGATFVGSEPSIGAMSVLLVAWLVLRQRAWRAGLLVASAMAVSAASTLGLKHVLARARPPASGVLGVADTGYSFPSGHTLSSTVFFGLLAGLVLSRVSGWRARAAVAAAWVTASVAVGLSRLYLGYHWLTDVLGGWSMAVVILALAAAVAVLTWGRRGTGAGRSSHAGGPAPSAGGAVRLPRRGVRGLRGDSTSGLARRARRPVAVLAGACGLLLAASACSGGQSPRGAEPGSSPGAPIASPAPSSAGEVFTVAAAGDIGSSVTDSKPTADLIESLHPDAVLPLGDNAYDDGSVKSYDRKYDPTWGRFKSITEPVPGNHEYRTSGASGYFTYFRAQPSSQAYYAWEGGGWRFYALNCEVDCRQGSPEETWLRKDLAAHPGTPALAYVHRPRFTCSTKHAADADLTAIWDDLQAADGQLMLAGHNHSYERFALLDGEGRPDPRGLRQFVVGTGGAELYPLQRECPGRQAQNDTTKGVLKLTLTPSSYDWQFVSVTGKVLDSGTQPIASRPATSSPATSSPATSTPATSTPGA